MHDKKTKIISAFSVLFLIVIWALASRAVNAKIILPSPADVALDFFDLIKTRQFLSFVGATVVRAVISFVIITLSGFLIGTFAGFSLVFRAFVRPFVAVCKATPVMSVILLAFFWFSGDTVPVFSAFLMAFPIMFVQMISGVESLDKKLDQMCRVYEITGLKKLKYFILPSLRPFFTTGAKQSLSMIWKVVIAAEVLTVPSYGVGSGLQLAQMNLQTPRVFSWTIVCLILVSAGDLVFSLIIKRRNFYEA